MLDQKIEGLQITMPKWEHPDSYFGTEFPGWYILYSRCRDSHRIANCNYETIVTQLNADESWEGDEPPEPGTEPSVISASFNHWAVGWLEFILVHEQSPKLQQAQEIYDALSNYSILDEEALGEMELNDAEEAWSNADLKERIDWCKESGLSFLQARKDELPIGINILMVLGEW